MSRPTDWSPLAESDPVPGEPEVVARSARHYHDTAEAIRVAATRLRTISHATAEAEGRYIEAFRRQAEQVAMQIEDSYVRYARTADALAAYAPALDAAQDTADRALRRAKAAQEEAERWRARAPYKSESALVAMDPVDLAEYQTQRRQCLIQAEEAEAEIARQRRILQQAVEDWDQAAERAQSAIENITVHADQELPEWASEGLIRVPPWGLDPDLLRARLERLRDADLDPARYRRLLEQYWTAVAAERAGIDLTQWHPEAGAAANRQIIEKVYRYYGDLYLAHPFLQWAGMANMIGPSFAAGFFDLHKYGAIAEAMSGLPPSALVALPPVVRRALPELAKVGESELEFYETTLLRMQREIFFDQAPMHEAYLAGGLPAVREMHRAGIIDDKTMQAWQQIDRGRRTGDAGLVQQGNTYLLHREQYDIIADDYDDMREHFPSGPAFTYLLTYAGEPSIPGAKSFADVFPLTVPVETPGPESFGYPDDLGPIPLPGEGWSVDNPVQGTVLIETPLPAGDISQRDERWDLISSDTLPAYQELITEHPERAREIIAMPVAERIEDYRLSERMDDLLGQLTDWDVRVTQ